MRIKRFIILLRKQDLVFCSCEYETLIKTEYSNVVVFLLAKLQYILNCDIQLPLIVRIRFADSITYHI